MCVILTGHDDIEFNITWKAPLLWRKFGSVSKHR